MPDQKISQLTAGGAAQATDEIPIARSGTNVKVLGKDIATALERIAASGQSLTGTQNTSLADLAATWNTTGTPTAIKLNVTDTASNAASLLMDLQVGGASQFCVAKNGTITIANTLVLRRPQLFSSTFELTNNVALVSGTSLFGSGTSMIGFSSDGNVDNRDAYFTRDAAAIIAQRNTTNAQTYRIYRTFTDASNYERGSIAATASGFDIGHEAAGTGTKRPVRILGASLTGSEAASALEVNQTWNTTGTPTAIKLTVTDTASNASSLLMDLRVGATQRLRLDKNGSMVLNGTYFALNDTGLWIEYSSSIAFFRFGSASGTILFGLGTSGVQYGSGQEVGWNSGNPYQGNFDVKLARDAAQTLAQRNSTNAQTYRLYRSFTDASNYSRLSTGWSSTTALIATEGAGTGSRGNIAFGSAALATSATVGYVMIPSCAGAPTGVPADIPTGQVALHYDTTNNKLYVYNGSWRSTAALT